jgi:catechol 2,3-dioxygenase-like lactoylglutathione lyase family enzyme
MKIKLTSLFVDDQARALEFYTRVLGFMKKSDVSAGKYRWLTVVSPDEPNGTQLVLEPKDNPAAKTYQESIFKQGIPSTMFFVDDIQKEYQRLKVSASNSPRSRQEPLAPQLRSSKIPAAT